MLRLKANKTSLYKLVEKYEKLPSRARTRYAKVPRQPDYFLKWTEPGRDGGLFCEAHLAAVMGSTKLTVEKRDIDGWAVSRIVYGVELEELCRRGMVEEFITAEERRRAERGAGCGAV